MTARSSATWRPSCSPSAASRCSPRPLTGTEALAAVPRAHRTGYSLDINLPGADGFAVAAPLAAACPGIRIVLDLSAAPAPCRPRRCARARAVAFVSKEELAGADLGALFTPAGT